MNLSVRKRPSYNYLSLSSLADDDDDDYTRSGDSDSESASEGDIVPQRDDIEDDTLQGAEIEIEGDFE